MSTTADTPDGIAYFRLASLKAQLKIEKVGMKSRAGALRPRLAAEFGLKPRDTYDLFINTIQARMDEILKARSAQ